MRLLLQWTIKSNTLYIDAAKILEEIIAYAKCFSQNIGHEFTGRTILITAMTGSAATDIGGHTTASIFKYLQKTDSATHEEIESFADTRLNIIDEISFASYRVLQKISANLQNLTNCHEFQYGSIDIMFLGDFCQLDAIGGDQIYLRKNQEGIVWRQALNCLVELKGTHRFKDPFMQRVMSDIRRGGLSDADRATFNERCLGVSGLEMPDPITTRFATFFNKARCNINAAIFKKYLQQYHGECTEGNICKSAIVIKANAFWGKSRKELSFEQRKVLFEECSEADTSTHGSRHCDPLLCLFYESNVMVNENSDVSNGIANGTTCLFKKAHLKPGTTLQPIKMYGFWVYAVNIDQVQCLELQWQDSPKFVGRFRVESKKETFLVSYPIKEQENATRVKASIVLEQFPVVVNFATTGHKLQGKSLLSLVIAEWSKTKNWAYVVLSRVRSLVGLFFTKPIPSDVVFSPDPEYLEMMTNLRATINTTPEQVSELKATYNLDEI